eukprot:COSAG06_NODE_717_length_12831_cov_52.780003_5_plen_66_part_00
MRIELSELFSHREELVALVDSMRGFPSVVQFNIFNEGWGQTNEAPYNATAGGAKTHLLEPCFVLK